MKNKAPDADFHQLRWFVAERTGLDFPESRWPDLHRGIAAAARETGLSTPTEFTARLMAWPAGASELESLVNHLTVGETYFYREKRSFEALAERILPALIRARRDSGRRLRIWSAACCTGEEPYSIAILLRRTIPDWADWNITVLATDINSRFLRKAISGVYGKWSFRDAPAWLCPGYFRTAGNGTFEVLPEIKRIVRFARLNLAEDTYPSPETDTNDMDVIFCRNVLMYFTEARARQAIQRLYRAQADGGWLIVGASELPNASCAPYVTANCPGAIIYQKSGEPPRADPIVPALAEPAPVAEETPPAAVPDLPNDSSSIDAPQSSPLGELAASFANAGNLVEALARCDQWIAADKLNSSSHYLRGVIMQERGDMKEAARSLRTALYLDPDCAQACFALGNIARNQGESGAAARHLTNAKRLLSGRHCDDPLPEFGGVTAGRFLQIVDFLLETEALA